MFLVYNSAYSIQADEQGILLRLGKYNGTVYPATVIQAGPCNITQIKTIEKDGYSALQIGYLDSKESKQNKPSLGHFKKSNSIWSIFWN